jgi:hypothetical protein
MKESAHSRARDALAYGRQPMSGGSSTHDLDPLAPSRLRVEHLADGFGIDVARPRLSWWLPTGAREQLAYRLRTNVWDSGRVDCDQHLLVEYAGPALPSRQQIECAVKVWTDAGVDCDLKSTSSTRT